MYVAWLENLNPFPTSIPCFGGCSGRGEDWLEMELVNGFNPSFKVADVERIFKVPIKPFNAVVTNSFAHSSFFDPMIFVDKNHHATMFSHPDCALIF